MSTTFVPASCPECGLPMSIMDDPELQPDGPVWYCDGPNDTTDQAGCFHAMPVPPALPDLNTQPDRTGASAMTTPNTDSVRPLIEGYHAVFDLKDAQTPGSDLFIQAADVARGIADLIEAAGGNAPQRYDRQGRQVALSAPDYAPLYDEAVESLGRAMAAVPHPKRALLRDSGLVLRELRALAMQAQVAAELDAEDEQIDRSEGK